MLPDVLPSIASATDTGEAAGGRQDQPAAPDSLDKNFVRANVSLLIWIYR